MRDLFASPTIGLLTPQVGVLPVAPQATGGQGLALDPTGRIPGGVLPRSLLTSPPANPIDGDTWTFQSGVNGENWTFRYNASSTSTYKWEFIGGPEVVVNDDGTVTTTSASYAVPTAGTGAQLTLTAVRAGDYIVGHSGYTFNSGANANLVGLRATGASDVNLFTAQGTNIPYGGEKRMNGVSAGGTIQPIVAVNGGTGTYAWRVLWVRPVRVA